MKTDPNANRLLELVTSSWISQATYVAAELGLADRLHAGPRTSAELAAETGAPEAGLLRLLRALATIEIVEELDDGRFELTELGALLRSDTPESLNAWTRWWGGHLWSVFGNLLHSVKTGESARSLLHGSVGFQHLERDAAAAATFNQALVELTRLTCESVMEAYDFTGLQRIVDVGGGYGELISRILRAYPASSGVLFDLPHAVESARERFEGAGLSERCELVTGDFFESVPAGADAYLLKSVLHDWDDGSCRRILEACRRAMPEGARLLVIEQVMPGRLEPSPSHRSLARSDLLMLVAHAARERSEDEFRELLESASFRVGELLRAGPTFAVIEAFPRR